tara:strand:+ start:10683 stop:11660 length:978 start_codon:yes stop_codon:yes gene_type:complete
MYNPRDLKHVDSSEVTQQLNKFVQMGGRRPIPGYNIVVLDNFLSRFEMDPKTFQESLIQKYPIRHGEEPIVRDDVQWVAGDHGALRYRGNVLGREKIWLQRGNPWLDDEQPFYYYFYTGVQYRVLDAQTSWDKCPEVNMLMNGMDALYESVGAKLANQAIVTRYRNEDKSGIGKHYDKPKSIVEDSLITVVKTGETGRTFNLYEGDNEKPTWSQVLPPGSALIMSLEANLATRHEVPADDEERCGDAGSIVLRTIEGISVAEIDKKQRASERARERAQEKKRSRHVHELDDSDGEPAAQVARVELAEQAVPEGPMQAPYFSSDSD